MPAYMVTLDADAAAATKVGGADTIVVFAADAADALDMAAAHFGVDSNSAWENAATATEVVEAADFAGFVLHLEVQGDGNSWTTTTEWTYTGVASDTMDLMGAGLVTATGTAMGGTTTDYTAGTQVFNIPADNNVGDTTIDCWFSWNGYRIAGLDPTVNAPGVEASARTATLQADAYVKPRYWASSRGVFGG